MSNDKKYLTYNSAWQRAYTLKQNLFLSKDISEEKLKKIKNLSDSFKSKSIESYELLLNNKSENDD
jgi:hypothetical protein